jgi:hypothetical protein
MLCTTELLVSIFLILSLCSVHISGWPYCFQEWEKCYAFITNKCRNASLSRSWSRYFELSVVLRQCMQCENWTTFVCNYHIRLIRSWKILDLVIVISLAVGLPLFLRKVQCPPADSGCDLLVSVFWGATRNSWEVLPWALLCAENSGNGKRSHVAFKEMSSFIYCITT